MNQIAILTGHTCGPACWEAREDVCRCSCGGKNHGCLRHANGLSPARSRKIDGDFYTLQAVGQYGTLDGDAMEWSEITEERFEEMLNVLPPAAWHRGAFMVGEAVDHHAGTGRPRFSCFKREGGKYFALSSPITHKQFCAIFGDCSSDYIE